MADLTPRQIVELLDRHIVGQDAAKRAVAVAIRNRWRRQQLSEDMRKDVTQEHHHDRADGRGAKPRSPGGWPSWWGAPLSGRGHQIHRSGLSRPRRRGMIRDLTEAAVIMVRQELRREVESKPASA